MCQQCVHLVIRDHRASVWCHTLKSCLVQCVQDDPWQQYECFNDCSIGQHPDRRASIHDVAILSSSGRQAGKHAILFPDSSTADPSCLPASTDPTEDSHAAGNTAVCSISDPNNAHHSPKDASLPQGCPGMQTSQYASKRNTHTKLPLILLLTMRCPCTAIHPRPDSITPTQKVQRMPKCPAADMSAATYVITTILLPERHQYIACMLASEQQQQSAQTVSKCKVCCRCREA